MNRHPFRWGSLAFSMMFLAAVGQWAVWRGDLLTSRQLSLTAAGVLIVLGLVGVAATLRQARPAPAVTPPTLEGDDHDEAAHPVP
ncbi:hypothetical protein [Aeromicrobium sp. Root472D3]|uniref:hypothetical protein n=1 Tax=Aeromicrobium sp. Root472D3 TaxID=1736540 RepID=UPI0006FF525D|nr:hypothetical protein [Aeromicrobium sp. Root472D3]KQX74889.1 hypothetical protein ASD10_06665 [Aeromicrobium sp. Root472D3]